MCLSEAMFRRSMIESTHIFMHTHRQNISVVSTDYYHKTKTSCMNQWDGLMPQQAMDGGAIDIFTWGCDSLVKEPSTPGNELPAWYISLTGWDCSGATWYCNSSNSLISHFSSITLPWHAEKSVIHIPTACQFINMSEVELSCGYCRMLIEFIPPFTLQR